MENRRIIQIKNKRIFVNPEISYTIDQTTFPKDSLQFSERVVRFFEVEMSFSNGILCLEVKNYNPINTSGFESQELRFPIDKIEFKNLDWRELSGMASMYHKAKLLPFLNTKEATTAPVSPSRYDGGKNLNREHSQKSQNGHSKSVDEVFIRESSLKIKYRDAIFLDGCVTVSQKVDWKSEPVTFTITNSFLVKEFDTIKSYFGKKINNKDYFVLDYQVRYSRTEIISVTASSREIAKIDASLIELIKAERILKGATLKNTANVEGSIHGMELNALIEGDPENILLLSPLQVIEILKNKASIRNKAQLEYLSTFKHCVLENLRYTLKPSFGFLFYMAGQKSVHFCWELLDTNATYIWSMADSPGKVERINKTVKQVQSLGRREYRKQYSENKIDTDIIFNRIDHKGISLGIRANFEHWKENLNSIVGR